MILWLVSKAGLEDTHQSSATAEKAGRWILPDQRYFILQIFLVIPTVMAMFLAPKGCHTYT